MLIEFNILTSLIKDKIGAKFRNYNINLIIIRIENTGKANELSRALVEGLLLVWLTF